MQEVRESEIVDLFSTILNSSYATHITNEYLITALMKLTTRFQDPGQIDRIRRILSSHSASLDVEIQQRAVEYGNLFGYDQIRRGVLEKMPAPEIREEQRVLGEAAPKKKAVAGKVAKRGGIPKQSEQDMLLDLMGGSDTTVTGGNAGAANGSSQNNADLLADILGGGASSSTASAPSNAAANANSSIMYLFGSNPSPQPSSSASADMLGGLSSPAGGATAPSASIHDAYSKNSLDLSLQVSRNAEGVAQVIARFRNTDAFTRISSLNLQAAVPKTQKLQLNAISSSELESGGEATQVMRISGAKAVSEGRL